MKFNDDQRSDAMTMTKQQFTALTALLNALVNTQAKTTKKPVKQAAKPSSYKPANKHYPKGKILSEGKTERQITNDVKVAKAFDKQGISVVPRVDCLTYKGWLSKGLRVKSGERGTWVKGVGTLFHLGQVETDVKVSKAQMSAETAHIGQ